MEIVFFLLMKKYQWTEIQKCGLVLDVVREECMDFIEALRKLARYEYDTVVA